MIVKGIKLWKSVAFPALLFMITSVFLFCQAIQGEYALKKDVKQYGRITCIPGEEQSEEAEAYFSQHEQGSWVYETEAAFQYQSLEKKYQVTGISSTMILGELVCGSFYADDSATLAAVINTAVLTDLLGKEPERDDAQQWAGKTLIMGSSAVEISGVIEDGTKAPAVWVSIPAICSYLKQQGELPKPVSYCMAVADLSSMEQVQEHMEQMGIETDIDQEKMLEWSVKRVQSRDLFIMAVLTFCGFVSAIVLSTGLRLWHREGVSRRMIVACVSANVGIGVTVGMLLFGFVQLWM